MAAPFPKLLWGSNFSCSIFLFLFSRKALSRTILFNIRTKRMKFFFICTMSLSAEMFIFCFLSNIFEISIKALSQTILGGSTTSETSMVKTFSAVQTLFLFPRKALSRTRLYNIHMKRINFYCIFTASLSTKMFIYCFLLNIFEFYL